MPSVFHITHIQNVRRIAQRGELCCDEIREREGLESVNIAHAHIKERRKQRIVECGPGGHLSDYVPFYFAPRSPMLYSIHNGFVEGYDAGQRDVVHLVVSVEAIASAGLRYVFTDGHAEMLISKQFDDLGDLDKVPWDVMEGRMWNDTVEHPDRKRRRQAEFLVHGVVPWTLVEVVGVVNSDMQSEVVAVLDGIAHQPEIVVRPGWYY